MGRIKNKIRDNNGEGARANAEQKNNARSRYIFREHGDAYWMYVWHVREPTRNVIPNKKNIQISARTDLNNTTVGSVAVK